MTNKEKTRKKAKEIAKKHARIRLIPCYGLKGEFERYEDASSELDCLHAAREMAEWKDEQLIEKAVEWLKENASSYMSIYWEAGGYATQEYDIEKMMNDFKKTMEE